MERAERESTEKLGRQDGRSMGGLWEVLGEVFHAFPFHNSLILRDLWKTTGGLGDNKRKSKFEDWKIINPCVISLEPKKPQKGGFRNRLINNTIRLLCIGKEEKIPCLKGINKAF